MLHHKKKKRYLRNWRQRTLCLKNQTRKKSVFFIHSIVNMFKKESVCQRERERDGKLRSKYYSIAWSMALEFGEGVSGLLVIEQYREEMNATAVERLEEREGGSGWVQ